MSITTKASTGHPNIPNPIISDSLELKLAVERAAILAENIWASMIVRVNTKVVLTILIKISASNTIFAPRFTKNTSMIVNIFRIYPEFQSILIGFFCGTANLTAHQR